MGLVMMACLSASDGLPEKFDVTEKSIRELSSALDSGSVTSLELVDGYLSRIREYDGRGPMINAMITINENARTRAAELDAERSAGQVRGLLHGIPVVVKDNYDTADMPTTAGTIALATSIPNDDATQVRRLREAGAIILGKTNMHELAYGITTLASLGGQTRNPYDPERNPGGSSGGTGAAVAASFGAFGMGSDTCGSIRIPSAHHALVGLRGTRGLASGDGIIPLSRTQDIGGPLARSVEDLALALDATVGFDPADQVTKASEGNVPESYTTFLNPNSFDGARFGIVRAMVGSGNADRPVREVIESAIEEMTLLGAAVIDIDEPDLAELVRDASVIGTEFEPHFAEYLNETPLAYVRSLEEIVQMGLYHSVVDRALRNSLEGEPLDSTEYQRRLGKRDEIQETVVALMEELELDALVYPTIRRTARPIGEPQPGSNCMLSASSGLPAITVPAGYAEDDMPVGVEFLGRPWDEARLIALAYAFEQGTGHRRPPEFVPSLVTPEVPIELSTSVQSDPGLSVRSRFVLDTETRILSYTISAFGLMDDEVLLIAVHFRGADAGEQNGPVIRRLSSRRAARASGLFRLNGSEMHLLREGRLYVHIHTTRNIAGAVRIDLALPEENVADD